MQLVMVGRSERSAKADVHRLALERLLSRSGTALVVCDAALRLVSASLSAEALLVRGELPPELTRVARQLLLDPLGCRRVELDGGRVVHLTTVERIPGPLILIWLREESPRDEALTRALRDEYGLDVRGQQLIGLLREGLSNRQIAARLSLREATVKTYLHELYRALGVNSRTGALACVDRLMNSTDFR
jgi:DNA-binding NarL/FixJ family response regulator